MESVTHSGFISTRGTNMDKLQQLCKITGMDEMELLEEATFDSVAASICINPGCDYVTEMEPDQDQGFCECCETNTVQSCLILAGII
jgi:hypothetical protein